jgi:hypothetical protein
VLGPTIFGLVAPTLYAWLFQSSANVAVVMNYMLSHRIPVRISGGEVPSE